MKNYYESIDELPLHNWFKINKGEIEYCRRDLEKGTSKEDIEFCDKISDSYYDELGIDVEMIRVLDLQKELAEARLDWVITGNNFIKNSINRLEIEIKELIEREPEGNFGETIIHLSKWIGHRIDVRIVTVKEFYNTVSLFKKEMEERKTLNNKNG